MAEAPPVPNYADAEYTREVGRLNHQLETTLAGDKETLSDAKTAYQYNNSLLTQQEPLRYAANRYKAVNEGVAQSGVNAERRGTIGANFLNQRTKLTTGLQQTQGRIGRAEGTARETTKNDIAAQIEKAEARAKAKLLAEAPNTPEPATYPIPPAQAAAIKAGVPAGPGGVVPYEAKGVRVGPAKAKPATGPAKYVPGNVGNLNPRQTAAKKAARR